MTILQIDKKYGTDFGSKVSQMPFDEFVGYVEMNAYSFFSNYEMVKSQFDDYKKDELRFPMDSALIIAFLQGDQTDRIMDLIEYIVDFLTRLYKRSDLEDLLDQTIDLANRLQEALDYREDNKAGLIKYMVDHGGKEIPQILKDRLGVTV